MVVLMLWSLAEESLDLLLFYCLHVSSICLERTKRGLVMVVNRGGCIAGMKCQWVGFVLQIMFILVLLCA